MKYQIHVKIYVNGMHEWFPVRISNSKQPYEFNSLEIANYTKNMCYPDQTEDEVKIVSVA